MLVQLRGTFPQLIPPVLDIRMNGDRHFESNLAAAASVQAAVKTNMSYRNDTIVVVSSQLTQIKAMLMLLWPLI